MSDTSPIDRCFTILEAAAHLRVSRAFLYKLIRRGDLRILKMGTRSIIRGSELTRFLDTQSKVA